MVMTRFDIAFSPAAAAGRSSIAARPAGAFALYGLWRGLRGAWLRLAAFLVLALALVQSGRR